MFETIRAQFFPAQLPTGISALPITDVNVFWQTVEPMMNAVFPAFGDIGAYEMPAGREANGRALAEVFAAAHHERFLMVDENQQAVGWSFGDMRDRETFFMTSIGLLPAYRQRGIYTAFSQRLLAYLSALGYERVVSNHQTNNRAVVIAKLKLGFNITAVNLDERWGAQVELTYLFQPDRRQGYERAFALEPRETPFSHHRL